MKPSEPKCGADHDEFILQFSERIKEIQQTNPEAKIEFEKPIMSHSGSYVGSADCIINYVKRYIENEYKRIEEYKTIISEFKPEIKSISDSIRQLKVYGAYYNKQEVNSSSFRVSYIVILELVTYEDQITERWRSICKASNIILTGIKRPDKKQTLKDY